MNLNLLTLFAPPTTQNQAPSIGGSNVFGPTTNAPQTGANIGDLMFGQLLAAQLQKSGVAAPLHNLTNGLAPVGQIGAQLKATVTQLLQNGATLEQVVNQLVQTLGSKYLSQLQTQLGVTPGTDVQEMVTQLLTQALGPPANGPPQPAAQAAAALVDRLLQVVDTLAGVSGNAAGQQQDSLGTISDANAGDNPAPNKTTALLQAVLAALQPLITNDASSSSASNATNAGSNTNPAPNAASIANANTSTGSNAPVASTNASSNTASFAPIAPPAPWVPTTSSASTIVSNA